MFGNKPAKISKASLFFKLIKELADIANNSDKQIKYLIKQEQSEDTEIIEAYKYCQKVL